MQKPIPYLLLTNFLPAQHYQKVKKALLRQQFEQKEADLFSFSQTHDLLHSDKNIQVFLTMVKNKAFVSSVNTTLETKARPGKVDAAGFSYADSDYLLCHNDGVSSRKIAYIMYFTTLSKKDGGALALYETDKKNEPTKVAKRIIPKENTLVLFAVTPRSFHAVEEVLTNKKRLTIAGWLHD